MPPEEITAEARETFVQKRLADNKSIRLLRLENYSIGITYPNTSFPPTDNVKVRQAILAALDNAEILDAATDGAVVTYSTASAAIASRKCRRSMRHRSRRRGSLSG